MVEDGLEDVGPKTVEAEGPRVVPKVVDDIEDGSAS